MSCDGGKRPVFKGDGWGAGIADFGWASQAFRVRCQAMTFASRKEMRIAEWCECAGRGGDLRINSDSAIPVQHPSHQRRENPWTGALHPPGHARGEWADDDFLVANCSAENGARNLVGRRRPAQRRCAR
jgi:hypothetical protein